MTFDQLAGGTACFHRTIEGHEEVFGLDCIEHTRLRSGESVSRHLINVTSGANSYDGALIIRLAVHLMAAKFDRTDGYVVHRQGRKYRTKRAQNVLLQACEVDTPEAPQDLRAAGPGPVQWCCLVASRGL